MIVTESVPVSPIVCSACSSIINIALDSMARSLSKEPYSLRPQRSTLRTVFNLAKMCSAAIAEREEKAAAICGILFALLADRNRGPQDVVLAAAAIPPLLQSCARVGTTTAFGQVQVGCWL